MTRTQGALSIDWGVLAAAAVLPLELGVQVMYLCATPLQRALPWDGCMLVRALMFLMLTCGAAGAQAIVTPPNAGHQDTGCQIRGLSPAGFVAIRAGPGTEYPEIGRLRNDDAAYVHAPISGPWIYVNNGSMNRSAAQFRGWIYAAWCSYYP